MTVSHIVTINFSIFPLPCDPLPEVIFSASLPATSVYFFCVTQNAGEVTDWSKDKISLTTVLRKTHTCPQVLAVLHSSGRAGPPGSFPLPFQAHSFPALMLTYTSAVSLSTTAAPDCPNVNTSLHRLGRSFCPLSFQCPWSFKGLI